MRMFQLTSLTSRAHFMGLILQGSAIVQLTVVNALPQPNNVQERQFAIQMEHARVNIRNLNGINDKPQKKIIVHSNIIFVINPIYFCFIHEHILLIMLQQQSNPGKLTNLAPGKLLLDNCMYETL